MSSQAKVNKLREMQDYYNKGISSQQASTILRLIDDIPDDVFVAIADKIMSTEQWFPSVSLIRKMYKSDHEILGHVNQLMFDADAMIPTGVYVVSKDGWNAYR